MQNQDIAKRPPAKMPYRPDIDGLRAVAVLLIILYHYFGATFPYAFVLVEIFFVISGYLISGIILDALQNGNFTFRHFYKRRILRIFPALILVLFVVFAAAWLFLTPRELWDAANGVLAGGFFVENFMLMSDAGYFAPSAHETVLLNLWTLGIEEQFYIIFPLFLWFCWRWRGNILYCLIAAAILSFAYNCYIAFDRGQIAQFFLNLDYYSPFTRMWILLSGAIIQCIGRGASFQKAELRLDDFLRSLFRLSGKGQSPTALGGLLFILGFVLLIVSMFFAVPGMPYPGILGILPTFGTCLIILANPANFLSRFFLANKYCVYIGKISYPLYLWHWPLISFFFIFYGPAGGGSPSFRVFLMAIAFILAIATYHFVELPIYKKNSLGKRAVPCLCGSLASLMLLVFVSMHSPAYPAWTGMAKADEFLGEYGPDTMPHRDRSHSLDNFLFHLKNLQKRHMGQFPDYRSSYAANDAGLAYTGMAPRDLQYDIFFDNGAPETVAVIGDSHGSLAFALDELAKKAHFNIIYLGRIQPGMEGPMARQRHAILDIIKSKPDIKKVLFVCRGILHMTGSNNKGERWEKDEYRPDGVKKFTRDVWDTVEKLEKMGKKVAVVAENPELNINPRDIIIRRPYNMGINKEFPPLRKDQALERQKPYLELLASLADEKNVAVLNTIEAFCPENECLMLTEDGKSLYFDDDHLSNAGNARLVEKVIKPWLLEQKE